MGTLTGYTKKQAVEMSGLEARQVQFFTETGVVIPQVAESTGRGNRRLYSMHNILQMHIIKALADLGVTISKIKLIMGYLEKQGMIRKYEEAGLHDQGIKLHIKIFKTDAGRIEANFLMQPGDDCVVTMEDAESYDLILLINFGRIARAAAKR